jgi:hypothetical protein
VHSTLLQICSYPTAHKHLPQLGLLWLDCHEPLPSCCRCLLAHDALHHWAEGQLLVNTDKLVIGHVQMFVPVTQHTHSILDVLHL